MISNVLTTMRLLNEMMIRGVLDDFDLESMLIICLNNFFEVNVFRFSDNINRQPEDIN